MNYEVGSEQGDQSGQKGRMATILAAYLYR